MHLFWVVPAALSFFFLVSGMRPARAQQVPVPKDFSYQETTPLGPVPFSHKLHVTDKKLQCPECHIKPKLFEMKKLAVSPQMTMIKLNEGQFCGACHDGKAAFSTKDAKACSRCHAKK
jgi:c(7)-type cytochrome triheme protein